MGGRWPYSCCFMGCYLQDFFNIACSILVSLPSSLFSSHLVSLHEVHLYSSIDMIAAWKKLRFILSVRSDVHMTDSLTVLLFVWYQFFLWFLVPLLFFLEPLEISSSASNTTGITINIFYNLFNSPARFKYLSLISLSFIFTPLPAETTLFNR